MAEFDYKNTSTFEKRLEEATNIRTKYPDRYPVIVEVHNKFRSELKLDKNKYLVPADVTVGQFLFVIRKRLKVTPEKALFFFVNDTIPPTSMRMEELYNEHKDSCGFIFINVTSENTFGC